MRFAVPLAVVALAMSALQRPDSPGTLTAHAAENSRRPQSPGFIKGYTWGWSGTRGDYLGDAPRESLQRLASTGTQWIVLAFVGHMQTKSSPQIQFGARDKTMVSDGEIRRAIRLARGQRFKIILKPVIDCRDGVWRALIDFADKADWETWWESYTSFLLHYAKIAAETKCEMFCVGCEMYSTVKFEEHWRRVISDVRKIYLGPIVYNANTGLAKNIKWLDSTDVIGVGAYYPVGARNDTSLNRMLAAWKPVRKSLQELSAATGKPILFMEIGMRSAATCSSMPSDWTHPALPYDGDEQARYYEAALQSFWNEPWFIGYCWWDWPARLYDQQQANLNTGFCIYGKPAEKVLRGWYAKPRHVLQP